MIMKYPPRKKQQQQTNKQTNMDEDPTSRHFFPIASTFFSQFCYPLYRLSIAWKLVCFVEFAPSSFLEVCVYI